MGKTIINVAITMTDDEWDRYDKRQNKLIHDWATLENIISDALINELGIISKTKITKIE